MLTRSRSTALLGQAFAAETWEVAGTERELFRDETAQATLVVAAAGRLVATASLSDTPAKAGPTVNFLAIWRRP